MLDIMIIGGGPAGMTAGLYAARMGLKAVVYERLMVGGQASTTNIIENYPGHAQGRGADSPDDLSRLCRSTRAVASPRRNGA